MRMREVVGMVVAIAGCRPAPYSIGPAEVVIPNPPPAPAEAARPEPPAKSIPDDLRRDNPFIKHRVWKGDYDCAKGRAVLTVRVVELADESGKVYSPSPKRAHAWFEITHPPARGRERRRMTIAFDEDTGNVELEYGFTYAPDDPGIVGPVPDDARADASSRVDGAVSRDGLAFRGQLLQDGCKEFRLRPAD